MDTYTDWVHVELISWLAKPLEIHFNHRCGLSYVATITQKELKTLAKARGVSDPPSLRNQKFYIPSQMFPNKIDGISILRAILYSIKNPTITHGSCYIVNKKTKFDRCNESGNPIQKKVTCPRGTEIQCLKKDSGVIVFKILNGKHKDTCFLFSPEDCFPFR